MQSFIFGISNISIVTRYPRDFQSIFEDFSEERTDYILSKSGEIFQWI
jgi:hypothetical protein